MRPSVDAAIEAFPNQMIAAEIGVFMGEHAYSMLQHIPQLERLYLMNPYEVYEGYTDESLFPLLKGNVEEDAHKLLSKYNNRIVWIKEKFGPNQIHEPLDFIYIDGNHDYEYVMWDLANSWEICRDGGIIGGHDYYDDRYGVKRAVDEYFAEKRLPVYSKIIDWWVVKHQFIWNL